MRNLAATDVHLEVENFKKEYFDYKMPKWVQKTIDSQQTTLQNEGLFNAPTKDSPTWYEEDKMMQLNPMAFEYLAGTNEIEEQLKKTGVKMSSKLSQLLSHEFLDYDDYDYQMELWESFHFSLEKDLKKNFWVHGKLPSN